MQKKILFCAIAALFSVGSNAQWSENFSDGDFTGLPAWVGSATDWQVNASLQLQSNNTVANSTFQICTPSTKATTAQWDFYAQINFNPSSVNYLDVFLTASASDLTQAATTGYFVRIGGTDDEVSLFRKDNGTVTRIIDGINGTLNSSSNQLRVTVIRDGSDQWSLSRTLNSGPVFTEGFVTESTYNSSAYFGILVKQSTPGFFQRHYIDDISVSDFVPDQQPPFVITHTVTSQQTIDILFNEPVEQLSSETIMNYVVDHGIGSPFSAARDLLNGALVHLVFTNAFPERIHLQMSVNGVKDLSANATNNFPVHFTYFVPAQNDVVIDELMADPAPLAGLPDAEWLELRNTTSFDINLQDWRMGKVTGQSAPMPAYILQPDSLVIVCTTSAAASLSAFGPTIAVAGFPGLNNTGDLVYLLSPNGTIIHSVNYTDEWYQNELKKEGGWSLEMSDTGNPCGGAANWKASTDNSGGTPGKLNSNDTVNPDQTDPALLHAYATDSVHIVLVFDEGLDSVKASNPAAYVVSDGIGIPLSATALPPLFNRVGILLANPLLRNKIYSVSVTAITDCVNNSIGVSNRSRVGLYEPADSQDIIVNEILFNPTPTGKDYVELYNRSNRILNLRNTYIAHLDAAGTISNITQCSEEDRLFFPEDFIVITESASLVKRDFITLNPSSFAEIKSMPSFNDDEGNVIILNEQGNVTDRVSYKDDWHFKLIRNNEGVSLERIDYNAPAQNEQNWHSAASSAGFGTPTYKNSQAGTAAAFQGEIIIEPEIFSPDNDGRDDFATIRYQFPEPGYMANIIVFDASGRLVRNLQRNALNGTKGYYRWDGLNDKDQQLPVGIYVVCTEVFNLKGKSYRFRNTIVLARKQ